MAEVIQASFAKGEVAPAVHGRVDTAMYQVAVKTARNIFTHPQGGASNRPGTEFIGPAGAHTYDPLLIPFSFKTSDQYMLEFGHLYMRAIRNGGYVLETAQNITSITTATPPVVTIVGHGLSNTNEVYITGVVGMTELNGNRYRIANVTADTFELVDQVTGANVAGTGYTGYFSGGTAARVFTLTTPYASTDLEELKYEQSADVMTLTHKSYATRELTRTGHTSWTLTTPTFLPAQAFPTGLTVTKGTVGAARVRYRVTAVGVDESLPAVAAGLAITAATVASPAVLTSAGHGLVNGDEIELDGFTDSGWTTLNDRRFKVANKTANTIELVTMEGVAVSSATFVAWTANGSIYPTFKEIVLNNITGITAANPGVVTVAAGHGIVANEVVRFAGIGGMVELNNRSVVATAVTQTTLSIENTTGYTAYTSGGSVWKPNTANNVISWTAVAGAVSYRIYKETNGVYGLIGSTETTTFTDDNLFVDYAEGPPRFGEPLYGTGNYPGAVGYFEQRRGFGGSTNRPDTLILSRIGSPGNLTPASPQRADDAITVTLNARQVNEIRHLVALNDLLVLTSGSEWKGGAGPDQGLSADTIKLRPQSVWGVSHLRPVVANKVLIYVEENNAAVRSLGYTIQEDGYIGTNLGLLASHFFQEHTLVSTAYVHSPETRFLAVRSDGVLLAMTFEPDQEVISWTRADTQGEFRRVAVLRHDATSMEDTVYFVVKRTVNGQTVRYIEKMASRIFSDVRDAFFVDCGLSLDAPLTISGITAANPVVVTSTSHGLSNGDRVDLSDIEWVASVDAAGTEIQPDQLNGNTYLVANVTANTFSLTDLDGVAINGLTYAAYVSGGYARKQVTSVGGLWHLEGKAIVGLANGSVIEHTMTVVNGTVALQEPASRIHLGLLYTADLETLNVESQRGTIQGKMKKIAEVTVRFEKTRGMFIGPTVDRLIEMKQRENEDWGDPTGLLTGDRSVKLLSDWNSNGRIFIRQKYPLPMTVLAVIPDLQVAP